MRNYQRRAMSLLELAITMFLVSVIALVTMQIIATALHQQSRAQARDDASNLAYNVFADVRSLHCGEATGFETTSASACWNSDSGYTLVSGNSFGDAKFTAVRNQRTFTVDLQTAWRQLGEATTSCYDSTLSIQPNDVLITATVSWIEPFSTSTVVTRTFTTTVTPSPDSSQYQYPGAGGLVVSGSSGTEVSVEAPSAVDPVSRHLQTFGPTSCAWFPYLEPGSVKLNINGSTQNVNISSNAVAQVAAP